MEEKCAHIQVLREHEKTKKEVMNSVNNRTEAAKSKNSGFNEKYLMQQEISKSWVTRCKSKYE